MKTGCVAAGLLLVALPVAAADVDDVDLEQWRRVGAPAWRFDPYGAEAGPGDSSSFLVSPGDYGDFTLSVEYWVEDATNSGVFVRCGAIDVIEDINPTDCYEVNIFDSHPDQTWRTGAIVTRVAPIARVETLARWTRLEISARGPRLEVRVDGTLTAVLDDAEERAGPLALQYAGHGLLRFRRLAIHR